jgi:hypothetical protein
MLVFIPAVNCERKSTMNPVEYSPKVVLTMKFVECFLCPGGGELRNQGGKRRRAKPAAKAGHLHLPGQR